MSDWRCDIVQCSKCRQHYLFVMSDALFSACEYSKFCCMKCAGDHVEPIGQTGDYISFTMPITPKMAETFLKSEAKEEFLDNLQHELDQQTWFERAMAKASTSPTFNIPEVETIDAMVLKAKNSAIKMAIAYFEDLQMDDLQEVLQTLKAALDL